MTEPWKLHEYKEHRPPIFSPCWLWGHREIFDTTEFDRDGTKTIRTWCSRCGRAAVTDRQLVGYRPFNPFHDSRELDYTRPSDTYVLGCVRIRRWAGDWRTMSFFKLEVGVSRRFNYRTPLVRPKARLTLPKIEFLFDLSLKERE